ncbi:hypothetical protein ACN27E_07540 [Mycobacterium sp. WMMD1722]|uniref:hypothetical protein n=1 Tax=Mycobacterium sp. WMMD1722 TaxID=3404117 RepID=UPI003BF52A49
MAALVRQEKAERQRDEQDEKSADQHRLRELASTGDHSTAAADADADLRKVMHDNADVLTSTAILDHTARFADARRAGSYAVLFGVLLRAVLAVPPRVALPPIIGGAVSLNLLLAVVGASGGGKGTADKVAADAVHLSIGGRRPPLPVLPMLPIGSGEGISRTYAYADRDPLTGRVELQWLTRAGMFVCPDIASIRALTSRLGSTLLAELLKAYMGEALGFANADPKLRVILPPHSYRFGLAAGVQPENGAVLLNDQAQRDGVPQRFLWAPVRPGVTRDPSAGVVEPLTVSVPDFGIDPMADQPLVFLAVAPAIRQQIIEADAAKDLDPFGRSADALAGHRLLAQLKLAAALAVLHGRTDVGTEDWQRAGRLTAVSTAVSRAVAAASGAAAERDAVRDGQRLAATDAARDAAALRSLVERVNRYLGAQTDWVPHSAVTRSVTGKLRRNLPDALAALVDSGAVERRKVKRDGKPEVVQYRATAARS